LRSLALGYWQSRRQRRAAMPPVQQQRRWHPALKLGLVMTEI
jgi:hypothetical protein